ncbi:MAG TPA: hypothetical protein VM166_13075, partial [Gemmatimonadaceae bacterium]|nr:hypothetical protein [Gemmatimonadaceae bacterium]
FAASERAVVLAPNDPVTWLVKGRSAFLMDPTNNTPRLFGIRKALALDATYVPAWFELGVVEEERFNSGAALAAFQRAADLDSSDLQTLSFIGLHYLWNNEYDNGLKWADSAVNLDPTYALAHDAAGQLALALGKTRDAQRQFEIQVKVSSGRERGIAFASAARAYAVEGATKKARANIDSAMAYADAAHPTKHEAAYIGSALAAMGDTAGAVRIMKAYDPREDMHFQLHLKRDPGLRWIKGSRWAKDLLIPDPR